MPLPTQPVGTLERVYTALYVLSACIACNMRLNAAFRPSDAQPLQTRAAKPATTKRCSCTPTGALQGACTPQRQRS